MNGNVWFTAKSSPKSFLYFLPVLVIIAGREARVKEKTKVVSNIVEWWTYVKKGPADVSITPGPSYGADGEFVDPDAVLSHLNSI